MKTDYWTYLFSRNIVAIHVATEIGGPKSVYCKYL